MLPRLVSHPQKENDLFKICHQVPGRMRVRIPALVHKPELARQLAGPVTEILRQLPGVHEVRANPACASFVLYHQREQTPTPELLTRRLSPVLPETAPRSPEIRLLSGPSVKRPAPAPKRTLMRRAPARRIALRKPQPECYLCQLKLHAARWILADFWHCWRQNLMLRLRTWFAIRWIPARS